MGLLPEVYYDFKFSEAREKLYHEIMMEEVTDKEVKRYNSETVVEGKKSYDEKKGYAMKCDDTFRRYAYVKG